MYYVQLDLDLDPGLLQGLLVNERVVAHHVDTHRLDEGGREPFVRRVEERREARVRRRRCVQRFTARASGLGRARD